MTDIIERLRHPMLTLESAAEIVPVQDANLLREAADEIERLNRKHEQSVISFRETLDVKDTQIEQLRITCVSETKRISSQMAEIERLREALEWYAGSTVWFQSAIGGHTVSSEAEIDAGERARAALEEDDGHEAMALYEQGYRAGIAEAVKVVENFKRDASFDDSQVGAGEHNANQANIVAAIRALYLQK